MDGNTAVIMCEREATDAAGAYPITPSTQMGEYWAEEAADGHLNISGRPLIFVEPESEHAAAGVTAGMSMTGLRATNFSSGQGIAFMHESAVRRGRQAPALRAEHGLPRHHQGDASTCMPAMTTITASTTPASSRCWPRTRRKSADLNMIARKTAELSLTPAIVRAGRLSDHPPDRTAAAARAGTGRRIPGQARRHHRHADSGAGDALRPAAPARARSWDVDNPVMLGHRCRTRTPTCSPWRRSVRISSTHVRPHRRPVHGRIRRTDRPPLQPRLTYWSDDADYVIFGHGQHGGAGRGRRRLSARDAQDQGGRGQPDDVPSLPGRPAGRRFCAARRAWRCWSAPTSRWPRTCR